MSLSRLQNTALSALQGMESVSILVLKSIPLISGYV